MKKINSTCLAVIFIFAASTLFAQVGVGTTAPNAALDITSTNDGLLIPRVALSNTATATVLTPTTSELVYNTATAGNVTPGFYYWSGTAWIRLAVGSNNDWSTTGNAGTVPGTNFFGTTDPTDIRIRTAGTDRWNISNANNGQLQPYSLGTAALPIYSFQTDTNTGIFSPAADMFALATGGSERMRINATGQVVVNNTAPVTTDRFSVYNTTATDFAVNGYSTSTGVGVFGQNTATGYGVYGFNTSTGIGTLGINTNNGAGVYGSTAGSASAGVFGVANVAAGAGSYGTSNGVGAVGVFGNASGSTGNGAYGQSSGTLGTGVYGYATSTGDGIYGQATGGACYGVWGVENNATGTGVFGQSSGATGYGVNGTTTGANSLAVVGTTSGTNASGVYGSSSSATGFGMNARNTNTSGTGIIGAGNNLTGLYLTAGSGSAMRGNGFGDVGFGSTAANGVGVAGAGNGITTITTIGTNGAGGAFIGNQWGTSSIANITGTANDATNRAAFIGNYVSAGSSVETVYVGARIGGVHYKIMGTNAGSVSTTMHTSQGERILFAPESPENWFFDVGEVTLVNGQAKVQLDPIFVETISDAKPFKVFVQGGENTMGSIRITRNQSEKSFLVEDMGGPSNGVVQYNIYAIWKGKENIRLPELKPEDRPQPSKAETIAAPSVEIRAPKAEKQTRLQAKEVAPIKEKLQASN